MKELAIEEKSKRHEYIVITQPILDYIKKNARNFENPIPTLGEKWIIDGEFTYSGVCGGQPVVEIHKTTGEFMRLPKSIIDIKYVTQYIDKFDLVAEIERRISENNEKAASYPSNSEHNYLYRFERKIYESLLSFIKKLEVKKI